MCVIFYGQAAVYLIFNLKSASIKEKWYFWETNQPTHSVAGCIIGFLEFIGRLTTQTHTHKQHSMRTTKMIIAITIIISGKK